MRLTALATGDEEGPGHDLAAVLREYEARDEARARIWRRHFSTGPAAARE